MGIYTYGQAANAAYLLAYVSITQQGDSAMARQHEPWARSLSEQRGHLLLCWKIDCDIDPMILRARQLRSQGSTTQAMSVEQELLPLF